MSLTQIDPRLMSAAEFVRAGSVLADIGTDHGYLPVFLLLEGKIKRAVLSDVNEGPLRSAAAHAKEAGVEGRVEILLADGCSMLANRGIEDYTICGMGGELIAEIISHAPHLKDKNVNLVLQPMSRVGHLRRYLTSEGFDILAERYSYSAGHYYVCLRAVYSGEARTIDAVDAELGAHCPDRADVSEYRGYLLSRLKSLCRAAEGKKLGGNDAGDDELLCRRIEERLADIDFKS